jgi:arginine decarboxylase
MSTVTRLRADVGSKWSVTEATELYDVARWGQGYFSVNDLGHVVVHPTKEPHRGVDLKRLIDRLALRGLSTPILLRFTDILKHRLSEIHSAFQNAIATHQYQGSYSCTASASKRGASRNCWRSRRSPRTTCP